MQIPQNELIRISLDQTNGSDFEEFAKKFLAVTLGSQFVPLGGQRDGGADGFIEENLYEYPNQTSKFIQISIEQDYKRKIRRTIKRLREFGREPSQLIYMTNQIITTIDRVEEDLEAELGVIIRVRDGQYIITNLPTDRNIIAAYYDHLHHYTEFLRGVGRGTILARSTHVSDPHVYTYLVSVLERETSGSSFIDGVVDAMILFALEGTDPNKDIMMSESEIRSTIVAKLPASEAILIDRLRSRLEAISAKENRRIRWHKKEDKWVLPYEERENLERASLEDATLYLRVRQELSEQFFLIDPTSGVDPKRLAELTLQTIQLAFEEDGLRFSRFLTDQDPEYSAPFVSDALRSVLDKNSLTGDLRSQAADMMNRALRSLFYASTHLQRTLLKRISHAYSIIFSLKGEPRVLKYFEESLSQTWLYVGADVLITALSERYLQPEDQHTRNLLKSASITGATLILTEPVLEEILHHVKNVDLEYRNFVEPVGIDSYEMASQVPKILIQAFLYTQVSDSYQKPGSWEEFINQFCNYNDLHSSQRTQAALTQLKRYLMLEFGLRFESWDQIKSICDEERHKLLYDSIESLKHNEFLASNDAYIYQLVTYRRSTRRVENEMSEYGYQTWWLSAGEGAAVRAMSKIDQSTNRILMRPSFLKKYIQLAPNTSSARRHLGEFLPSVLGIRLARQLEEEDFRKLIETMKEAEALEEGRRASKMADCMDQLRGAMRKELDEHFIPANEYLSIE